MRIRRPGSDRVGRYRNRSAQQRIQRIDPVLRRLHANVVVHAVGPVHPEIRRHRAVAAQRDQHAAGNIALRQTQLRGLHAIHIQEDFRLVNHLVNMDVGSSRNARNPLRKLLGDPVVGFRVPPDDLQVDRSREPEAQNLSRDIGRLEEERHVREFFAQALPQQDFVIPGRAMFLFLERNQDFTVSAGDGGNVSLRDAGPAVRNPDVIDQRINLIGGDYVPDGAFNRREP